MFDIVKKVMENNAKKIKRYPCHVIRASSIGYFTPFLGGCLRRGVYEQTRWEDREMHTPETQAIFNEGNHQEKIVLADLAEAGIETIEQQSAFVWKEYNISGHIDCCIIDEGVAVPIEIKSMHPNIYTQINAFEDFRKKPWTKAYMGQITLYMLMKNIDRGLFILKNKSTGMIKTINVNLDYALGEECLLAAETINDAIKNDILLPKIDDRQTCKYCPFKLICCPDIDFGEPLKIEDDPLFEWRIKRHKTLKESADEAKKLWDTIKESGKAEAGAAGTLNMMVGPYHLTGKTGKNGAFRLTIGEK